MKISEMLKREFILGELKAKNKREVLAELAGLFAQGVKPLNPEAMLQILMEREMLGSTGIGDGIAIPHGKLDGLDETVVAFGRSREGVGYEALDGKPVHLFFVLAAPKNSTSRHLKALAKISRMLKDGTFRKNLLDAKGDDEIVRIIAEKDNEG